MRIRSFETAVIITLLFRLLPGLCGHGFGQDLKRIHYNNPGLSVDLGVGLWAWPMPMDFDSDGDLDLVVNCPDKPYNGVYFFENAAGATDQNPMPVFLAARRISQGMQNVQLSYPEGEPVVLTPGAEYLDFRNSGLEKPQKINLPANIHPNRVRANMWRYVDYEGDGDQDLIVGVGDWSDYGWDDAYSPSGEWMNGPLRGFVYLLERKGSGRRPDSETAAIDPPVFEDPVKIEAADQPVEVFGWPSPNFADFDGDGDLDLLCGEFLDGFTYFENIGSRTRPLYAEGRRLRTTSGEALVMDLQMITPTAIDWNRDGHIDLICGDEDGRVAFIEHAGKTDRGQPLFLPPRYFEQKADAVKFGALSTPWGFDWDGDGDIDILSGNTAGYLGFIENLSGPGVEEPVFGRPAYLRAGEDVIRIMAGPNGSIQGPAEEKWGYTTLSVADWDHDGLPDLVVNSIWGRVIWFQNVGTRRDPQLAPARSVEVEWEGDPPTLDYGWLRPEGKELLTQWRTTPVAFDWNEDGLVDLVMLDHQGYLAFFERKREEGRLLLSPPRRIFLDETGQPIQLNAGKAGKSGRRKLCITDWDGDGKMDFLVNGDNAILLRQIDAKRSGFRFVEVGPIHSRKISGHSTSPTTVDWNGDEVPDALIGSEDGHFYYLRNSRSR